MHDRRSEKFVAGSPDLAGVLDIVAAGRDVAEQQRRLSADVIATLTDTGLFRLGVPAALGGPGCSALEVLDVIEAITMADASAGWCVWNNLLPTLLSQRLAPDVRAEIVGDAGTVFGNSTRASGRLAVSGEGGFSLSGQWSLVSGCQAATSLALLGLVTRDGVPQEVAPGVRDMRLAYVPAGDVAIVDTWSSGGLRGSGSHDVVVADLFVPAAHTCPVAGPAAGVAGPLDRIPTMALLAAGAATMLLGLGRVCFDTVRSIATEHVPTDGRPQLEARPAVATGLARASANLRASRAAVRSAVGAMEAAAEGGNAVPLLMRAEVMEAVELARRLGLDVVRSLYELGGTASVYTSRPLERAHRDAHVMAQHVMFDSLWAEQAGRVRLGLQPTNLLF